MLGKSYTRKNIQQITIKKNLGILLFFQTKTTFKKKKLNLYGDEYPITKQNCLNHIYKKNFHRLDNIKTTQCLGAKGESKFTKKNATLFDNF